MSTVRKGINNVMDYKKHYKLLCERAKTRSLDGYIEKHHIIPRCMGGTDDSDNLVNLTPEEHYVAHQLLVKIYPSNSDLIYAANMMSVGSRCTKRNNKRYGWLKKRYISECRKRTGKKNPSYGKSWYHNPKTLENIKCLPDEIPVGFVKGRKLKHTEPNKICVVCNKDTGSKLAKFCSDDCRSKKREIRTKQKNSFYGRENELINLLNDGFSISESLEKMGYKFSNTKSGVGKWASEVNKSFARLVKSE